jgi:S-DNA-T family DNA segregation ATPase FtsK/SpoIIIE
VAWLGEANAIKGPTEVRFRAQGGANLLIVGQQKEAALGVVVASVLSLGAAHPPRSARFVILDGSPPELGFGAKFAQLAQTIPQDVELVEYGKVPEAMEALDAELKSRQDGSRSGPPTYVVIFDLQRFRKLRQGDEFDFSSGAEDKPTPAKCLAALLAEGPSRGMHVIVWGDSVNNLNRTFTRKMMKEFEMRVPSR